MELILPKYELLDLTKTCWTSRFHVSKEYLCFPAPEVLRFIVKTCYSYSVHLHKLSVYLHALTF